MAMPEYWLQKKTLGGWSPVTWYDNLEQAEVNYQRCLLNRGYSYRLVQVEVVKQDLLNDAIAPVAPSMIEDDKPKPNVGWDTSPGTWATPSLPAASDVQHGMVGKVWMINHVLRVKKRVDPSEVDAMIAQGYEAGGPKTAFKD